MKYQKTTIIKIAQSRGSSAKTKKGAWKYLRDNLKTITRRNLYYPVIGYHRDLDAVAKYRISQIERRANTIAQSLGYDPHDPHTPGKIRDRAWADHQEWLDRCRWDLARTSYGGTYLRKYVSTALRPRPEVVLFEAAQDLLRGAVQKNLIPRSYDYIDWDDRRRADGYALHHEIYDFRKSAVVVCLRCTEGTRYGIKTLSKTYMLIESYRRKITATETKEPVAKLAKSGAEYGSIIARICGEKGAGKLTIASPIDAETAYKALAVVNGKLCSIYSGETYELGKLKRERAGVDHNGGYYCYPTAAAAADCDVPKESKHYDAPRVISRCLVGGTMQTYGSGKMARTYLRPVEIVASVLR